MIELFLLEKRETRSSKFGNIFELRYPCGDDNSPEDATDLVGFLEVELSSESHAIAARVTLNISDLLTSDSSGFGGATRQNIIDVAQHTILLLQLLHSIKLDMNLTVLVQNLPTAFLEVFDYDIVDRAFFGTAKSA